MYITAARHHSHETPRSKAGTPAPLREIRDDVRDHTLFPPLYYFQPSVLGSPAKRSSRNFGHYDSLTVYTSGPDDSARRTLANVAASSPSALHPTGKVDSSQVLDPGERKRRLNSRDTTLPSRPPARRPGHLSHKSASAIPTLSQINIGSAPYAPSPLGSPTTSTASARSSRRPSAASLRSVKSWLGRPATSSMAMQQDNHFQQQSGNAADLLRQAMKHGSRYVSLYLRYFPFCATRVALFSANIAPPLKARHYDWPRSSWRRRHEVSHVGESPKRPAQRAPATICNLPERDFQVPQLSRSDDIPPYTRLQISCERAKRCVVAPRFSRLFEFCSASRQKSSRTSLLYRPIPNTRLPLLLFSFM